MLNVYFGTDTIAVRKLAFEAAAKLADETGEVIVLDAESYVAGSLQDALGATSLFGGQTPYILDTPSGDPVFASAVHELAGDLASSSNQFIVIEGALLLADKKHWAKHAESMEEVKATAGERFNSFALADALAKKDKKSLWLILQAAKQNGLSTEELIGVLWWQLKALRSAARTKNAAEAGMKDYPYDKAKRSLKNFAEGELERLSRQLLTLYHQGHAGKIDIAIALEKWCLTL